MTDDALSRTCCPEPSARLSLWPGRAVYSGPSLELDLHAGSVAVLAVGNDKEFTLETADGTRRTARSALIRARVPHRIEAHGGWMTFCYFEPGSAEERACVAALGTPGTPGTPGTGEEPVTVSATEEKGLVRLCLAPGGYGSPEVGPGVGPDSGPAVGPALDPRIRVAARRLLRDPHLADGATEFAAAVGLSRSRFLHLFREQTGTSFRRYRMWARMLRAGRAFLEHGTLTDAAAEAGFSSPSHLSSAFHATFGLRPSRLLAAGCVIVDETYAM